MRHAKQQREARANAACMIIGASAMRTPCNLRRTPLLTISGASRRFHVHAHTLIRFPKLAHPLMRVGTRMMLERRMR